MDFNEITNLAITGTWLVCRVNPCPKPRMTRSDRWKKRKCTQKYWEFKDQLAQCLSRTGKMPDPSKVVSVSWIVYFPFPKSMSEKERALLKGQPRRIRPDRDNIDKAILDAIFGEDSGVAIGIMAKLWDDGKGPRIEILIN